MLSQNVEIPVNTIFESVLGFKAIDTLFGGLTARCIGSGTMSLHNLLEEDEENPQIRRPKPHTLELAADEPARAKREKKLYVIFSLNIYIHIYIYIYTIFSILKFSINFCCCCCCCWVDEDLV